MTNNDIDISVVMLPDTGKVYIRDNADYSTLNVDVNAIKGLGQMAGPSPSGTLQFQKFDPLSPLIDLSAGDTTSAQYSMPVVASGAIVNGTYTGVYEVYAPYVIDNIPLNADNSINAEDQTMTLTGDYSYMESGDTFTVAGSLLGNNGVKTLIADVVYDTGTDSSLFTCAPGSFAADEGGIVVTSATIDIDVLKTYSKGFTVDYSGCTKVTPTLTIVSSCTNENIVLTNTTDTSGQTVVSKTLSLYYPAGLTDPTPVSPVTTTTSNTITLNELATGTWTGMLSMVMSYTSGDLEIQYTVSLSQEALVACETDICCMMDCINATILKYAPEPDCPANDAYEQVIIKMNAYGFAFLAYQSCGDAVGMATMIANLKALLGEDCDCGCTGTTGPQWIGHNVTEPTGTYTEMIYENTTELLAADTHQIVIPKRYMAVGQGGIEIIFKGHGDDDTGGQLFGITNTTDGDQIFQMPTKNFDFRGRICIFQDADGYHITTTQDYTDPTTDNQWEPVNANSVSSAWVDGVDNTLTLNLDTNNTIQQITVVGYAKS